MLEQVKTLYIPVWIDLKRIRHFNAEPFKNLYIPVWIDLKESAGAADGEADNFTFQYG